MKNLNGTMFALLAAASTFGMLQAGCSDDDTTTTAAATTAATTAATGSGGNGGDAGTGGNSSGTGGASAFVFDTADVASYVQVDRHGAVEAGTVGIAAAAGLGGKYPNAADPDSAADISKRDAYNASNPKEDAAGKWLPDILASVETLQTVLKDDLIALKLTPATKDDAVKQAGPVIVPDTIKYDPTKPVGYPNGRALEDQVVDITIAAALLKLGPSPAHPLDLLAKLPLNPPKNDVPFKAEFPYLADPH